MDVFAHTLWAAAACHKLTMRQRLWGAFFGVAPDLLSFGLFFVQRLLWGGLPFGKPELPVIPEYVYHIYNFTHSLVMFGLAALVAYLWRGKRMWWPMWVWALHIVIDVFTHGRDFFPTPFLWPVSGYTVNSFSWGEPWFLALNYTALAAVYVAWYVKWSQKQGL